MEERKSTARWYLRSNPGGMEERGGEDSLSTTEGVTSGGDSVDMICVVVRRVACGV